MKSLFRITIVFSALLIISSCAALRKGDLSKIQLGMSKATVQLMLKVKPDNVVSSERDPIDNSVIEVVQYSWLVSQTETECYWLYFVNDKLDSWHKVRPDSRHSDAMDYFKRRG